MEFDFPYLGLVIIPQDPQQIFLHKADNTLQSLFSYRNQRFLDITKEEGIEVRKLDIVDEDIENISIVQSTLSFSKNYDIDEFFKELKSDFHLKSVSLSDK